MYDLIVIGSGPGGYEAAAHAGKSGLKTLLIEKNILGGTCLNIGCIPTKTLLYSAKILRECRNAETYGISTAQPGFDLKKMLARKDKVVTTLRKGVEQLLKKSRVEIRQEQATLTAEKNIKINEEIVSGRNILLATGSSPAKPNINGIDQENVIDSSGALCLEEIPETIAIIGAGAIGLEFASYFNELGSRVSVFDILPHIAGSLDREISAHLQKILKRQGIDFILEAEITAVNDRTIEYRDKNGDQKTLECRTVLNAAGRVPCLENLGLEQAGVVYDRRRIKVDRFGKTNISSIWACGDVTGRCLLAHAATREGIAAVNNMLGKQDIVRYQTIPSVIYTYPEVASVGKTEETLQQEGVAYLKNMIPMTYSGRFMAEMDKYQGYVKVLIGSQYKEILGIHVLGSHAGEMIYGCVNFLENEMRVPDIAELVFPHPTVSEAIKEAIMQLL